MSITAGPDGNTWFAESAGNKIGKITPEGKITEFPLPTAAAYPGQITQGPDRNLWFTESGANAIGRITPQGVITEFYVGADSSPLRITAGPDGTLWFTQRNAPRLRTISTSGDVRDAPATLRGNPRDIVLGADGNIWIAEGSALAPTGYLVVIPPAIGKITPRGQYTRFGLPYDPYTIINGPAGTIWYARIGWKLGRISQDGSITEFDEPYSDDPAGIAMAADGNLWFTPAARARITRLTNDGVFTQCALAESSGPLASGADGGLWMITFTNRIARYSVPSGSCPPPAPLPGLPAPVITVSPAHPMPGDSVSLSINTLTSCYPFQPSDGVVTNVVGTAIYVVASLTCIGFIPPPPYAFEVNLGALPAGAYEVRYSQRSAKGGGNYFDEMLRGTLPFYVGPEPPPTNYQGLWFNPAESGWGISFAHQGDLLFASWFTYDVSGKGTWLVMTAAKTVTGAYAGQLFQGTGPAFDAVPFPPLGSPGGAVVGGMGGTGTITFSDANNGVLSYTLGGIPQTKTITRQLFGPQPACAFGGQTDLSLATNYTDLWWASPPGSEAGWGINLAHQGDIVFATWFTFDHDHTPMWLVVQANKAAPNTYVGTQLFRLTGPPFFAVPFPALGSLGGPTGTSVGTATFVFTDGNAATFSYTVNGVTQTKMITREVFVAPGTVCQ